VGSSLRNRYSTSLFRRTSALPLAGRSRILQWCLRSTYGNPSTSSGAMRSSSLSPSFSPSASLASKSSRYSCCLASSSAAILSCSTSLACSLTASSSESSKSSIVSGSFFADSVGDIIPRTAIAPLFRVPLTSAAPDATLAKIRDPTAADAASSLVSSSCFTLGALVTLGEAAESARNDVEAGSLTEASAASFSTASRSATSLSFARCFVASCSAFRFASAALFCIFASIFRCRASSVSRSFLALARNSRFDAIRLLPA